MACPLTPPYVFNSACSDDDKIQLKRRGDFADKVFLKKFKVLPSADSSDSESCSETEIRAAVSQRQRTVSATKLRRRRSFAPSCDVQARQRCLEYLVSAIDEVWARFCACTSFAEDQHYAYDMPSPKQDADEDDEIEDSGKLQALKERLTKAKYYLQDLSDVSDMDASVSFWNRWDLVKYAVIEFVEDNGEEDEVIEGVCGELEDGRL